MLPTDSSPPDPELSTPIRISPITAVIPAGIPTDVVMLDAKRPVPLPVLDDDDWPRVLGSDLLSVIGTGGMGIV